MKNALRMQARVIIIFNSQFSILNLQRMKE